MLFNKRTNNGSNETKAVEETRIDKKDITNKRAGWKKNKAKREEYK